MPQVANILTGLAADRLHQTHGTAGRPAVVGFTKDENGNMVIVYADGCLARRVPDFSRAHTSDWKWEAMEGPSYDALFTRETGAVDAAPPRAVGMWAAGTDLWLCGCKGNMAKNYRHEDRCPDCGYTRPADD